MHKARENHDGTFSIGKTWQLDDLSAIQSYNAFTPTNPAEQQQKQWASNVGFTVTIQKPYYWHARSAKEKEFFIASLLKIYRKYTGGRIPQLIGFDDRERQLVTGAPPASKAPPSASTPPEGALSPPHPPSSQGSHSLYASPMQSREDLREYKRRGSEEHSLRAQRSRDQIRRPVPPPLAPPQGPPPAIPQAQDRPSSRGRERPPGETRVPKTPIMAPELKSNDIPNVPPLSQRSKPYGDSEVSSLASSQQDLRPPSSRDGRAPPELRPALRTQNSMPGSPEAKRSKDGLRPSTPVSASGETRNIAQSPGDSPGQRNPFNESSDKVSTPEMPVQPQENIPVNGLAAGYAVDLSQSTTVVDTPPATETAGEAPSIPSQDATPSEANPETAAASSPISPTESYDPAENDPDGHRPGLGPMVKKKEVAGAFRKAATAYGAFKPRPGGAGERLLAAAKKQRSTADEPDGITSVVPAPSLLKAGNEPATPDTPDRELASPVSSPSKGTPTVEVTQASVEEHTVVVEEQPRDSSRATIKADPDEKPRSVSPSPNGGRRRRREDNTIKYCQSLGIDPKVLDGRGINFDDILTDLGWNGRLSDDKRIEDLEADVRREIGRVEATSWLGNLEQQEGKVDHLARLIDKTIDECEELDGLLTLYAHELNVSDNGNGMFRLLTGFRPFMMMCRTLKPSLRACRCKPPIRSSFTVSCKIY